MAGEIPRLKTALDRTLRDLGLDKRLKAEQLSVWWTQIVGPAVANIASPVQFRNGTLFIDVGDHLWMQELKFQERELIERLNQMLGEPLVRRLFFQLARTPSAAVEHSAEEVPSADVAVPLDPQQEEALEREVASVRDPQLREVLKGFRRRLLQARPSL
jgi:predicted nucleic acid-binding Zn ribbon protein